LPVYVGKAQPVAQHATRERELAKLVDGGQSLPCRECNDPIAARVQIWIGGYQKRADACTL